MRKIKLFTLLFILSTFVVSLFAQGQLISFTTKKVKGDAVVISILGEGKSYIEWENGIKEPFSMNGAQNILLKSSSFKIGSENGKFEWLYCKDNELTKLDLTNAKDLTYISCMNNQLKELNTSKNLNLKHLYCSKNNLTNLDLSGNFSLKNLDCSENKLTELNISNNKKLVKLFCNTNFLTSQG